MRTIQALAADGVLLHAEDHGPVGSPLTPVICLPGLTRNSRDFEPLIPHIAQDRRVLALDLRGRGKSGRAADPATYTALAEAADTQLLLAQSGIRRAVFIGTSRGGIVSFIIRSANPRLMAGLVLNDIGPKLEPEGLLRIRSYLGVNVRLENWNQAAEQLQRTHPGFTGLADADWLAFARRVFDEVNGKPASAYDPAIATTFPAEEDIRSGKVPELWDLYARLGHEIPIAILRGETSDLLSEATVAKMLNLTPQATAATIPGRGHVPFLDEPESLKAIQSVLDKSSSRP